MRRAHAWTSALLIGFALCTCERSPAAETAEPAPPEPSSPVGTTAPSDASAPDVSAVEEEARRAERIELRRRADAVAETFTLGGLMSAAVGISGQPELTFVHVTDVEIGFPDAEARFEVVSEALRAIRPVPDFYVFTGDLTHSFRRSQIKTFLAQVETLPAPVYLIPGNHDLGFHPEPSDIAKYIRYFDRLMPFKEDIGDVSLIAFDSQLMNIRHAHQRYVPCCALTTPACDARRRKEVRRMCRHAYHGPPHQIWQPEAPDEDQAKRIVESCTDTDPEQAQCVATPDPFMVALSAYQWSALKQMMRDARFGGKRLILAHHIPPVANVLLRRVKRQWRDDALVRFRALLRRYRVEAQLVGHFHKDEIRFIEGVPVLSAPPVSPKYDRQSGYRIYRVWPDGLSYTQVYVGVGSTALGYTRDLRGLSEEAQIEEVRGWTGDVGRDAHWRRYAAPMDFDGRWEELRPELYWETLEWEAKGSPALEP